MEAKGNIRKEVFARRRAATQEEIQEKSRMIYEKITALPEFLDADCFFAYMDFKKEVMTRDLIEKALQMGKTVAVPRVEGDDMVYYEIKDFSTLKSGRERRLPAPMPVTVKPGKSSAWPFCRRPFINLRKSSAPPSVFSATSACGTTSQALPPLPLNGSSRNSQWFPPMLPE